MTSASTHPVARRLAKRVIARLDIKGPRLVKGIHLEGLRVIGDPAEHAVQYYRDGIDELVYMDVVASLYGRNSLTDVVAKTAQQIFVPLTVGGGVRNLEDISALLRAGADKIAINTAAIQRPELVREASRSFGAQCLVVSIEAKRRREGGWEAYTDNGRVRTGLDVLVWARRAVDLGAGELLVTSIDQEGTRKGFDLELVRAIASESSVPVIAGGGAGTPAHVADALDAAADGVSVASLLHYKLTSIPVLKSALRERGHEIRT